MSKYTTEQLQEMAQRAQNLRHDPTYVFAISMPLALRFGLTQPQVEARIDLLAAGLPMTH